MADPLNLERIDASDLTQLEPSPVDETPGQGQDQYFPSSSIEETPTISQNGHALGLSQHSAVWYLTRIQKYSSYVFSAFAAAHISNTSLIPLITRNVPDSERFLLLTRPYYQGIPAEPLLIIIPAYAHVLSGLALRIYRRNLHAKRYGYHEEKGGKLTTLLSSRYWPSVSGISKLGFQFTPLLLGHAVINRVIPNKFPGGSSNIGLNYVSHGFAKHPIMSYLGFTALLVTGCFHITWGFAKWQGWTPDQVAITGANRKKYKKRRWWAINAIAALLTATWMAGGFGVIGRGGKAPGWVGRQYDEMYASIPLIGNWLASS